MIAAILSSLLGINRWAAIIILGSTGRLTAVNWLLATQGNGVVQQWTFSNGTFGMSVSVLPSPSLFLAVPSTLLRDSGEATLLNQER